MDVNHTASVMLGHSREELAEIPISAVCPLDILKLLRWVWSVLELGQGWTDKLDCMSKTGEMLSTAISASAVDIEGRDCMIAMVRDNTEGQQAGEALMQHAREVEQSNAELETIAYLAAHAPQEPLRSVARYLRLLAQRYKGKKNGAKRMQALMEDLLISDDLLIMCVGSRGDQFEPTDCVAVFDVAIANLQRAIWGSGARVTRDSLPTVSGDASQLTQLLQNLVGYAIMFRGDNQPRVHFSAKLRDTEWVFSVQNNGIGIQSQYIDRMFIPFQRLPSHTEYPGTGVGLAICKRIVERHGGTIWAESEPGKGSAFYFTIPRTELFNNEYC